MFTFCLRGLSHCSIDDLALFSHRLQWSSDAGDKPLTQRFLLAQRWAEGKGYGHSDQRAATMLWQICSDRGGLPLSLQTQTSTANKSCANFTVSSQLVSPNGYDLFAMALETQELPSKNQFSPSVSIQHLLRLRWKRSNVGNTVFATTMLLANCCEHFLPNVESLPAVAQ